MFWTGSRSSQIQADVCAEEAIDCSEDSEPLALIRPASLTPKTLACTVAARASLLWMMLLPRACSSGGSVHPAAVDCAGCCLDLSAGPMTIAGGCPSCHTAPWACLEQFAIRISITPVSLPRKSLCLISCGRDLRWRLQAERPTPGTISELPAHPPELWQGQSGGCPVRQTYAAPA